ncbi:MAG: glycosyltransferase, partial [Schleiferiaceae bacterium]|nr:glycosyltransferase [Schleiferiaceae bacterium]
MRVLLLANKFPYPAKDGSSIALMRMIDTLLAQDNKVHLFALNTLKHKKDTQLISKEYKNDLEVTAIDINTNITASNTLLNLATKQPFHVSRFYKIDVEKQLIQVLKEKEFDVVQFEGIFMAPYLDAVKKHSKAKTVLRPHNVEHLIWKRLIKSEKQILKGFYLSIQTERLRKFEMEYSTRFDAILPISAEDGKFFSQFGKRQLSMPCALEMSSYPDFPSTKNNFFHFGAMDWMPNVNGVKWLINEVWPKVVSEIEEAKLVIAGKNMPEDLLGLNDKRVEVVGEVNDSSEFYKDNGIMLVPLLSGSGIRIK